LTSPDRQGALAALTEARRTLSHLDRARSGEDLAADVIDIWNSTEKALRALAGVATLSGQQLVRAARQAEVISLDQAHALLEFLAARDRVNRTSYTPTPADSAAASEGFKAVEAAASGARAAPAAVDQSPYAPSSPYAPPATAGAAGVAAYSTPQSRIQMPNAPLPPPPPPPNSYQTDARRDNRWSRMPLWMKIALPVLLLLLIGGGYYLVAGRNSAQSHLNAGIDEMQRGQREAAHSDFSAAAREDDKLAAPHIFLARLSRQDGDLATARSELDEALRVDPANEIALREMGLVMFASGNYELARRFFVRAVLADPGDRAAQGYLGCALSRLNRTAEAMKFLNRAGTGAWSACAQPIMATSPPL
jgi:tetratricopeptide (TPR) repeat protein